MSTVVLVLALPRNATTGATVTTRLAGGGTKPYDQLGSTLWQSGIANLPRFSAALGFDQGGWTGGALPQTGAIRFFPSNRSVLTQLGNLNWDKARITLTTGDDELVAPAYTTQLVGTVSAARTIGGALTLTIADLSVDLDKPVLPDTFAGTGGVEGGDDATGRIKRRSWGLVFNVEGRVLDKAYNIYEFGDPNRPLNAFPMVKDKGREYGTYVDVAWAGSAAATLTALRAASVPANGVARAPSIAACRPWTVPAGPITADIQGEVGAGYVNTVPNIANRIVSVYSTDIAVGNLAEAQGWQAATAGVHCDEASETVGNLLDRLLLPVRIAWLLGGDGVLAFRRFQWTGPIETLLADTIERDETFQPLKTRRVGFQRNHRQHSDAEISAALLLATDATYADGTPIETLKPGEAGATLGARAGTNLKDSVGAVLNDNAIRNLAISIGQDGTLAGAGGGQVTIGGLGYVGDLSAAADIPFVLAGANTPTVKGNAVTGTGGTYTGWARFAKAFRAGARIGGRFRSVGSMVGLGEVTTPPDLNQVFLGFKYSINRHINGNWYILNGGSIQLDMGATSYAGVTFSANTYFEVVSDGRGNWWFYADGVLLYSLATGVVSSPLYAAATTYATGTTDRVLAEDYADVTIAQPIVGKLDPITGRVSDPAAYNTAFILGPSNTTNLVPAYTVGGSNVTVTLPAHNRKIQGVSAAVVLAFGGSSGVIAFSTYWAAYIVLPNLISVASPTVVFTTNPDDLLVRDRYQISSGVTPASGGTGGDAGGGGGNGGGFNDCVAAESFMPDGRRAMAVRAGDVVRVIDETTWANSTDRIVQRIKLADAPCVRLVSESGATVVVSESTPCTMRDGECVLSPDTLGVELAVEDDDGFRWERIIDVQRVGFRAVAHLSCGEGTYAAGEIPGRFIFTHNTFSYQKP